LLGSLTAQKVIPAHDPNNIVVTFGSCNTFSYWGENEPADIFYRIAELNSDVFAWLGDAAYVDIMVFPPYFKFAGEKRIKEIYHNNKIQPEYTKLRETTPIVGVWDDHDFGIENGNKYFEHKDLVQQLFLDFLDEPKDSPRRKQKGVYVSYYVGDESKVHVILLDVRYFRDTRAEGKDILGDEQWKWLEEELKNSKAEYILIGSGTQIFPDDRFLPESWFEWSRQKLYELIRKYKRSGVVLLSGDVHYAEFMKYPCKERIGYDLWEFTSSGLTHFIASQVKYIDEFTKRLYPTTYNDMEDKYMERNFGVLNISFGSNPGILMQVRNYNGHLVLEKFISKKDLTFNESIINLNSDCIVERKTPGQRFWERIVYNFWNMEKYLFLAIGYILFILAVLGTILFVVIKLLLFVFRTIFRLFRPAKVKKD